MKIHNKYLNIAIKSNEQRKIKKMYLIETKTLSNKDVPNDD